MAEPDPHVSSSSADAPSHGSWRATVAAALRGDAAARKALRRKIFHVIEVGRGDDLASRNVDTVLIALILLNIAAFMAETVPSIQTKYGWWLNAFEAFSVGIFTLEYVARIWTAIEVPFLARMTPLKARFRFARRPFLLIDLLSILPFYLTALLSIDLRLLRVVRLVRFLKLSRYSPAMHTLVRVISKEGHTLLGAALLLSGAVLVSSTGIYYLEHAAQPEKFTSIPESAYWAITTLTTVGYGDVTPITSLGKLWAGLTMVIGLCILALPVAIIANGFAQEAGRRDFVVTWSLMSRIPLLAEMDATQVAEIMPLLHANNATSGAEIIAKDAPGAAMYFVAAGAVELSAGGRIARYVTGDFFGAVAMLDGDANPGSFRAVARTRLLKLHREDFNRLERINPNIGAYIRRTAVERRRQREAYERALVHGDG